MEAEVGIEPTHKAFAEPCLTTWLLRHRNKTLSRLHWFAQVMFLFGFVIAV